MIRILLADDHAVVRRGLRLVLERESDLTVVGEVGDGADAVRAGVRPGVDLVILDLTMPGLSGLQACRQLKIQRPAVRVLILSMHDDDELLLEALDAGASGYVVKSVMDRELVDACRTVMRGETYLLAPGLEVLVERYRSLEHERRQRSPELLTDRERQIVKLVGEGQTTRKIAETLSISTKTVESHRTNIFTKLEIKDRVELTHYAIRTGLVEL